MADVAFIGFIAMTLAGGLVAITAKQLIHAVLGLVLSMIGVAGLYIFLANPFIAAMQVLIYVGAVSISMVFAVMLARPPHEVKKKTLRGATKYALGALVATFTGVAIGNTLLKQQWVAAKEVVREGTTLEIGKLLLTDNILAFELISLVLLVAIVGSVVIARRGRCPAVETGGEQ